jgi:zinc D-Ala-D-Ala carboxypeptidase
MNLSDHFTLEVLTFSSTGQRNGIDNTADDHIKGELKRLCNTVLEPVRDLLGVELHIDSSYRCPAINTLVKGAKTSQHMLGQAADIKPVGFDLQSAFYKIKKSDIPYDQIIIECGSWIHISCAHDGAAPRKQCMIGKMVNGKWAYSAA